MKNLFVLTILFGTLIGCSNQSEFDKRIKSLEESQAKWTATKAPTYSYEYRQACFCAYLGQITVVVDNDSVVNVLNTETNEPVTIEIDGETVNILDAYPEMFYTIDTFFDELKEAAKEADEMDMTFNSDYGYPADTYIDYYKEAIDDEISYHLDNLKILTTSTF